MEGSTAPDAVPTPEPIERVPNRVRLARVLPLALPGLVMLVAFLTVTPWPVGAFQDDAIYTVLAKALANGDGYRMINLPGAPHATHYPPGYPFFLSLLWRLSPSFPDNIVLFKFANAIWLSLAALGAWAFARTRLGWESLPAAAGAAAGTLTILVLLVTGVVLSEPMFMALLFPALLLSEKAASSGSVRLAVAAGLACGALALVRTLGAVIIPAAVVVMFARRNYRGGLAMIVAAALCLAPWQLWLNAWQHEIPPVLMGKYGSYGPWMAPAFREQGLAFVRDVAVVNLQSLFEVLSYAFMPVRALLPRAVAFVGVCGLVAVGLGLLVRHSLVTALFLVAYGAVVIIWPFEPTRFVLAVWPLLMLSGLAGIVAIWRWRAPNTLTRGLRYVAIGLAVSVAVGFATYNARGYRGQWWASIQRDTGSRAKPIVEWVAARTAPSDVLMTDDDLLVYLYTGRQGTPTSSFLPTERVRPPTDEDNVAAVRTMIDTYEPRYYITTSEPGRRAAEALSTGPRPLLRRHRLIPNAFIYERITP
jgi:hypothetical protein